MSNEPEEHWLVSAARALELPGADRLHRQPGEKVVDVWSRVRDVSDLDDAELTQQLADRYLMRVADLASAEQYATRLVPAIVAVKYHVLPLRYTDRTLDVATSDPHDVEAEREVSRLSTRAVRFELAAPDAIREALANAYVGAGQPRKAPDSGATAAKRGNGDGGTHVLVVDDDPETATLLESFLSNKGFEVTAVRSGPEALDVLERDASIDAVSLDYYMHPMNGLKVLQAIRSKPAHDDLPVVMLTSSEDRNIEMSLFEAGADDYVVKPLDPPRYFLRLRAVLRRRATR
ncbi:MAG: response regulator [Gemmatimonadota bacterium]|nr:response regulator [Gemmatimonadota bacterium]